MKKLLGVVACLGILIGGVEWADAQCVVNTSTPTYVNGKFMRYLECDASGQLKSTATGGSGGAGDASAANQVLQNGYLDGLETLITSTNTKLDTVISSVNTELPAAAALADATANPTVPGVASFNMCFNGTTWDRCAKSTAGNGAVDSSTQRVTIANDSTGTVNATQATAANLNIRPDTSGATGAAPPARADFVGGLGAGATGGFVTGIPVADTFANVNVSTATTTLLVTGVSGRHVRISSLSLITAAANNVALISGTGATCGTGTTGMNGGTTAASGWNFAANGGITQGNGLGTINRTNATGDSVCIVTSAATQLSGRLAYTIY